ncbi:MAG TPA: hypothetical protein VK988_02575 [Acidimicrobiales bacterium]|nr:hypothetical protein [Acidimicrobiales bacterium]
MTDQFRTVGDTSGRPESLFAPPKQRRLSSDEILRCLTFDPNDEMDHGRIRAWVHKLQAGKYLFGVSREQELLEWSMQVEPKRRVPEQTYDNPARLRDPNRKPRALTLGDFEFVRSFEGVDPKDVPPADVRHLAELEAAAESYSERSVVARVMDPIRRFHDLKEEQAVLANEIARHQPSGWRSATVREAWEPVLAERLAEEVRAELEPQLLGATPELRQKMLATAESEARAEARQRIRDLWAGLAREENERVAAAQARLSALAGGADPASSAIASREPGGMEEGRRRGREAREAREAKAEAFANFQRVG